MLQITSKIRSEAKGATNTLLPLTKSNIRGIEMASTTLSNSHSPSKRVRNLNSQEFGRLTVIGLTSISNRLAYWLCRCSCKSEQSSNQRRTIWLTINGETLPTPEWARRLHLPPISLRNRILGGWCQNCALTLPFRKGGSHKRGCPHK